MLGTGLTLVSDILTLRNSAFQREDVSVLWLTMSHYVCAYQQCNGQRSLCVFMWLAAADMKLDIGDMEVFDECDEA